MKNILGRAGRWNFFNLIALAALAAPAMAADVTLIPAGFPTYPNGVSDWHFRIGTSEASTPIDAWRTNSFIEDGSWSSGFTPIGYTTGANDPLGYEAKLVTSVPTSATANYTALFLRKTFVITNRLNYSQVSLNVVADDGCVAWLNGREIMRFQCCTGGTDPAVPTYNAAGTTANETTANSVGIVNDANGPLVEGTNVLCIELFNANTTSSDLVLDASLNATLIDTNPPVVVGQTPAPGLVTNLMTTITVNFSEPVTGVTAGSLLVNGQPAIGVSGGPSSYTFNLPNVPFGTVQVSWANNQIIADLAIPPNAFNGTGPSATWQYAYSDTTPPVVSTVLPAAATTVLHLSQIEVFFNEPVTGVNASDLLINGTPATIVDTVAPGQYVFQFTQPATGSVQVAWAPGHGIADTSGNAFAGGNWTYLFDPNAAPPNVIINEFMASNDKTLHDEDGDSSDWIELYNGGSTAVNLLGWYLTDDQTNLRKWKFPGYTIGTNEYLVVFASSKDRTNLFSRLHTNFKLGSGSGYLGLVRDDGVSVNSAFAPYPGGQKTDVSFGRDPLQPALTGFFNRPTPGSRNTPGGGAGFAPDVDFSVTSSTFSSPFNLTLSLKTPMSNAVIRYVIANSSTSTIISNFPTTNSLLYTNPIPITGTMEIRARAFAGTNVLPGDLRTEAYIQINTNTLGFSSDLPIIILHNNGGGTVPSTSDQFVMMQVYEPKNGKSSLTNAPDITARGIFHLRGSSTLTYAKSSFFFESEDEFGDSKAIPLLGMPDESDWVFYAPNNFEGVLIHNPTAYALSREIGRYASRTRFAVVLLSTGGGAISLPTATSGNYNGIYVIEEKIKIDKNRVDIDKLQVEDTAAPAVTGGYTLSVDRVAAGEAQLNAGGQLLNYGNPHYAQMSTAQWTPQRTYISNYFVQFNNALNGATWTNPVTGYTPYVDADAWIDHHIINVLTFNVDALRLSGYLYKSRNGPIAWGPVWDFDRTQGSSDGRDFNPRTWRSPTSDFGTDFFNPQSNGVAWWGRMFNDPNFFQKWVDRWQEFRAGPLSATNINAIIDKFVAEVKTEQPREQARWAINPRSGSVSASGFTFVFSGGYTGEVAWMKAWYSNRLDFIDTNFLARPVFSSAGGMVQPGFQVTLAQSPKAGTVTYYTMDGSDPRALHGGIAPNAIQYTGPITITNNARIVTRSINPNHRNLTGANNPPISVPWSGPNAATFVVHTPDLAVTEIMFHPGPTAANDTNDVDNYEYIELKNVGTNTLNLVGYRFTNGIDFTFTASSGVTSLAPGGYVLLVKNYNAFTNRYGFRSNIAGEFGGNLDNGGERLVLVGAALEVILDFTYHDSWNTLADGSGFSLVLVNEATASTNYNDSASWRQSNIENGTPGAVDPGPRQLPRIVISEALTHTDLPSVDAIELQNLEATNVNVSGWYLSDSFGSPKKFVLPNPTIIPAGGFVVFDENQFNAAGAGFALSSEGDSVWVFSAEGAKLTGAYHGFDFGPAQNGVTFGRYTNSQGQEYFVAQATNSLNASNALPRVGPIVISEIHYHPPEAGTLINVTDNSDDEFVELHSITNMGVPLYDTLRPSNTWKLTKGVDFVLPTNIVVPAGGYVVLVNFDPILNPTQLAQFQAKFGVPQDTPIFGPLGGKLDNSSDTIKLSRPDAPNPSSGFVPYIEVDRVTYNDAAPWAGAADGFGPSLQRVVERSFANDPTNWVAAIPTAGRAFVPGTPPVITQQPQGGYGIETSNVVLTVAATGAPPLGYQWRFNGAAVPGGTNSILIITNALVAQSGVYNVAVFNGGGAIMSDSATVSVRSLPRLTITPLMQTNIPGSNTTISVGVTGIPPYSYQWRYNGNTIPGATASNYVINNLQLYEHAGLYDVFVTDSVGTALSAAAIVNVKINPIITNPPVSLTVAAGQNAMFYVVAGPVHPMLPLSYRWVSTAGTPPNNTNVVLLLTNCQANSNIRLNVSNPNGQTNITAGISLTVLPDGDHDGLPDAWETANGFDPGNASDGNLDADNDGMSNVQEFLAGTDPRDPNSVLRLQLNSLQSGTNAVLTFSAVSNRSYQVQGRAGLSEGFWTTFFNLGTGTTTRVISLTNGAPGVPARFYRIQTP